MQTTCFFRGYYIGAITRVFNFENHLFLIGYGFNTLGCFFSQFTTKFSGLITYIKIIDVKPISEYFVRTIIFEINPRLIYKNILRCKLIIQ